MEAVAASVAGVVSFNGRTGIVVARNGDLSAVGGALFGSPPSPGSPAGPTAAPGTATQHATTAFASTGDRRRQLRSAQSRLPSLAFRPQRQSATTPPSSGHDRVRVMNAINAANAGVISHARSRCSPTYPRRRRDADLPDLHRQSVGDSSTAVVLPTRPCRSPPPSSRRRSSTDDIVAPMPVPRLSRPRPAAATLLARSFEHRAPTTRGHSRPPCRTLAHARVSWTRHRCRRRNCSSGA